MPSGYYGNAADDVPSYFSGLQCRGFENSLSQCWYNRNESSCPNPQRDAAVSCGGIDTVVIPGSNKILVKSSIKFIPANLHFFVSVDTMSL